MKDNFDACLANVLKNEGGWADDPRDPGGATMEGITMKTFQGFIGREASKDELRNIPNETRDAIYRQMYWDPIKGDSLDSGIDAVVMDHAVNAGVHRAQNLAASIVGSPAYDVDAINSYGADKFVADFTEGRANYYRSLKIFAIYGKGWLRRAALTSDLALKLINNEA